MTLNSKGFQPSMALNSALAHSIKGFSPLSFIVICCYCTLPNFPNLIKFSVLRQQANAAIKPSATAVAHRRCKRRQLKIGTCSQIFNFAFWGIYAATDIAEAERGRVTEGEPTANG